MAISDLFAAGELGVWWEINDLSTVFEDDAGTTPASVGGEVGRLEDKSGNAIHVTQGTTAAKPILRQDANGNHYLEFDGLEDELTNAAGLAITGSASSTLAVGARYTGPTGSFEWIVGHGDDQSNQARMLGRYDSGNHALGTWGADDFETTTPTDSNAFHFIGELAETDPGKGQRTVWIDGVEEVGAELPLATDNSEPLTLGTNVRQDQYAPVDVYGVIILNRVLTTAERDEVEAYIEGLYTPDSATAVSRTEPASAGDGFAVVVTAGVGRTEGAAGGETSVAQAQALTDLTESASASDTHSAVARIAQTLTETVQAQDAGAGPAIALGTVADTATGNDLADAVAQAAAAIAAGAVAGDTWVAHAQAVVDLLEVGEATDVVTRTSEDVQAAALSEGTVAGASFAAAIQTIADLTESATSGDALAATMVAIVAVSETAHAGAAYVAVATERQSLTDAAIAGHAQSALAQIMAALNEVVSAGSIYAASSSVSATITASATASDAWAAATPGIGYLAASAITITASLGGASSVKPALSGTPRIRPN